MIMSTFKLKVQVSAFANRVPAEGAQEILARHIFRSVSDRFIE